MPDPQSHPATAKKLGGIPQGEDSSPSAHRKSPTFKMKAIERPRGRRAAARHSPLPAIAAALGLLAAIGGPAAYFSLHPSPRLIALLQPLAPATETETTPASDVASSAPAQTTPRTESEPGYLWLFDEKEWQAAASGRELRDGLLHLSSTMSKPQPNADATIRARVRAQESGDASIFLRSTKDGRYRLTVDGDRRYIRLIHDGASGPSELGKERFYKTLEPHDWITLELRAEDSEITARVNGKEVIVVNDTQSKMAGNWGIESKDGWYQLVEIPAPKPKKAVAAAKSEPEPAPAPKPEPAPAAPTPPPAPVVAGSETARWLAGLETQWEATFQQEVIAPYEKAMSDLRKQFRETVETQYTAAQTAKKFDDAAFFRGEKKRLDDGEDIPMTDEPIVPVSLKTLRNGYRNELVRLDRERFNRAKGLFTRIESQLTQSQATLTARKRNDEAAEVKAKRDQLAAMWLKPPLTLATPAPIAGTTPGATPSAVRPAIGATPAPSLAKLPLRQVVEKLLAMGAEVHVTPKAGGNATEVKAIGDLLGDKFVVTQVDFRANAEGKKPPTTEDLMIVEALDDATDLSLRGAGVTDAVFEKMKNFRHLDRLTLEGTKLTAAGLAVLPTFSELRELNLYDFPLTDDAAKWVGLARKLERIRLSTSPITDAGMGFIAKLTGLQELDLNNCDKLGGAGVVHLASTHSLKRLSIGGSLVSSPMLEALAKCTSLEYLTLSGNPLKDEQVAVLGTLTRLHTLNLNNTDLVGTAFATWPTRTALTSLNFVNKPGVNDAALKAIGMAFPKLENLDITAAPQGVTVTGFTSVAKLRSLRNLHVNGAAVTDDFMTEIAKCGDLQTLNLPDAKLGEPGASAIGRLAKLTNLQLDVPPVTDAALKSLARCKTLKTIQIGAATSAEDEAKLKAALPTVTVTKRGEG